MKILMMGLLVLIVILLVLLVALALVAGIVLLVCALLGVSLFKKKKPEQEPVVEE